MNLNIFLAQIWKTFSFEVYNIYFKNNNYVVGVDEEEYFVIEYDQNWNIVDTIYRSGEPDKTISKQIYFVNDLPEFIIETFKNYYKIIHIDDEIEPIIINDLGKYSIEDYIIHQRSKILDKKINNLKTTFNL